MWYIIIKFFLTWIILKVCVRKSYPVINQKKADEQYFQVLLFTGYAVQHAWY